MYVDHIELRKDLGTVRAEACITWEDTDRVSSTLFIETDVQFEGSFWADPNGFLIGLILPAWRAGEHRIRIDGYLCPVLVSQIHAALGTLKKWNPELGHPPAIETQRGLKALAPFNLKAASFLSCGIDSLATLRLNKTQLPPEHPASIHGAIVLHNLFPYGRSEHDEIKRTEKRLEAAKRVSADVGVEPIPVRTNMMHLSRDGEFFSDLWIGAVLASIAHFFSKGFNKFYIASGGHSEPTYQSPCGSHPLLDPYYSSAHLQIEHHGTELSRFKKTALVASWQVGLDNIFICEQEHGDSNNCGTCKKCIQTQTALVAMGKLHESRSFRADDVTPALLQTVEEYNMLTGEYHIGFYRELIPLLTERGRTYLVEVINKMLYAYEHKTSKLDLLIRDIQTIIPLETPYILVDQGMFVKRMLGAIPFLERDGLYWGPPPDDATAIEELTRLREAGARFIAFAWPAFWWLDFYSTFHHHLRSAFRCVLKNERLVAFDLSSG